MELILNPPFKSFRSRELNLKAVKRRTLIFTTCVLFALCMASAPAARAQSSEFGALVGTSFYLGDLNQAGLFKGCHLAGGVMYRYNFSPRWALKANILFGKVSASDAGTLNAQRNLSFMSPISELSVQAELNFLKLYNAPQQNRFTPYIFAGLSLFSFDPQAQHPNGTWYELQSLGTEGQGIPDSNGVAAKRYSLTSFAIPFGIGFKVTIGRHICLGAEWGIRYTFTDYLDDVRGVYYDNDVLREQHGSIVADLADRTPELIDPETNAPYPYNKPGTQRGNTTTTDLYSFAGIFFTVKFGNESKTCDLHKPRNPRH